MKHIKSVSASVPASASILTWGPTLKANFGAYVNALFAQFDNRTADPIDGDIGDAANL
jgi:hypothetical protein